MSYWLHKASEEARRLRGLHHAFDVCLRVLQEPGRNARLVEQMQEIRAMFCKQWPIPPRPSPQCNHGARLMETCPACESKALKRMELK